MSAPSVLILTPEQVEELARVRDSHAKPHFRVKAAAVLKVAQGHSIEEVRLHGLLKPVAWATLKGWIERYQKDGLEGWQVQAGRGRKPAFSPAGKTSEEVQSELEELLHRDPQLASLTAPAGGWLECARRCPGWLGSVCQASGVSSNASGLSTSQVKPMCILPIPSTMRSSKRLSRHATRQQDALSFSTSMSTPPMCVPWLGEPTVSKINEEKRRLGPLPSSSALLVPWMWLLDQSWCGVGKPSMSKKCIASFIISSSTIPKQR